MRYELLDIDREGALAIVTMKRPETRNALSFDMLRELRQAAFELRDARDISAIILTGSKTAFSSGADRTDNRLFETGERDLLEHWRDAEAGSEAAKAWENLPQITIAALEGFAIGGGFTMAMACDFRVIGESAFVQIPEVPLGLNYGWNSIPRLVGLVGPSRAKRIVVLGERIPAQQCTDWGLADFVAPDGQGLDTARGIAERCTALPQMAVQFSKRAINAVAAASQDISSHADMAQILLCFEDARRRKPE